MKEEDETNFGSVKNDEEGIKVGSPNPSKQNGRNSWTKR